VYNFPIVATLPRVGTQSREAILERVVSMPYHPWEETIVWLRVVVYIVL
jgi:hypothetical protein